MAKTQAKRPKTTNPTWWFRPKCQAWLMLSSVFSGRRSRTSSQKVGCLVSGSEVFIFASKLDIFKDGGNRSLEPNQVTDTRNMQLRKARKRRTMTGTGTRIHVVLAKLWKPQEKKVEDITDLELTLVWVENNPPKNTTNTVQKELANVLWPKMINAEV